MSSQRSSCLVGMRVERTANPYEDVATCPRCGQRETVSYSREFGERVEDVKQSEQAPEAPKGAQWNNP